MATAGTASSPKGVSGGTSHLTTSLKHGPLNITSLQFISPFLAKLPSGLPQKHNFRLPSLGSFSSLEDPSLLGLGEQKLQVSMAVPILCTPFCYPEHVLAPVTNGHYLLLRVLLISL